MSRFVFFDPPREVLNAALPLYAELAAIRMQLALIKLALKYSPSQPRVPTGNPDDGQWTNAGGIRVAGGAEDEETSRRSIIEDPMAELRQASLNNSIKTLRRLEPDNPKLTYFSDGIPPDQDIVNSYRSEVEAAKGRVAASISGGHALQDHAAEFGFPSQAQLQVMVRGILDNPSRIDDLPDNRTGYYDRPSNTFVIVNPGARDGGSVYKLRDGESYIDTLHDR